MSVRCTASGSMLFGSPHTKSQRGTTPASSLPLAPSPRPSGATRTSITRSSPSSESRGMKLSSIAGGLQQQAANPIVYRLKLSGSGLRVGVLKEHFSLGETHRRHHCRTTPAAGTPAPNPWDSPPRMPSASSTSAPMSTNGAVTGMTPATMRRRPSATHAARRPASAVLLAEGRGVITSRLAAALPAPASHPNSSTPTTAFAWHATAYDGRLTSPSGTAPHSARYNR